MVLSQKPNPWLMLQPHDAARFGDVILDPKEQARWSGAIMVGGLPFMWKEAAPIRAMIYDRLELRPGDRVLLIGESNESCGFVDDLRERVGPEAEVRSIDIIERARDMCFSNQRGKNGKLGTWRYDYVDNDPDDHYDAIVLLQGVQHTEDWVDAAQQFVRVLKPGRTIATGEIAFGEPFAEKVHADVHIQYVFDKIFGAIGQPFQDLSYWSVDDLKKAFGDQVIEQGWFVDRGFECFWGRKPTRSSSL